MLCIGFALKDETVSFNLQMKQQYDTYYRGKPSPPAGSSYWHALHRGAIPK